MDNNIVWHNYATTKVQRSEQKSIRALLYGLLVFLAQVKVPLRMH